MNKGYIPIVIICLLLGYIIGYTMGVAWAMNWGVDLAVQFASYKGIDIDFDKKIIVDMLIQYSAFIVDNFSRGQDPMLNISIIEENASILYDERS